MILWGDKQITFYNNLTLMPYQNTNVPLHNGPVKKNRRKLREISVFIPWNGCAKLSFSIATKIHKSKNQHCEV